ncbi:M50 family metallopeptidase [Streptomyces albipurpureus]|uniref:M50 family metallopeptidase n=1 Tax=Streptomyces albipurpureus TaxID=2897419 RepID=A0ABT0UIS3_9ACTN|nr:M50 family metallopeptidase [Streptomyces sp. CWNU-1]MCM2388071.1 M50 family metallopeptidase [Streptomyces sp. CWNU-1]
MNETHSASSGIHGTPDTPLASGSLGESLGDLWDRVFSTQPAPEQWLVIATAVLALAAVAPRPLWRLTRNAITIAHEGGHGLIALLTGRSLEGIRLHSDTSGLTVSRGKPTGLGMILTAAAGYTAPPLLGLGGAWLLAADHITLFLWLATALLLVMLVMIRNAYGALTVILTGAAFLLISWLANAEVQAAFAYTSVWFLLVGGVRPAFELQSKRRHGGAPDSDADQLARLTHAPAPLWLFLFHAVSACSLIGGGRWLLDL